MLLFYTVFLLCDFGIMYKNIDWVWIVNKRLVFLVLLLLPALSWANCKKHEATEVSVLQLVRGDVVLWQSEARLAQASVVDGVEALCFVEMKSKQEHYRLRAKLDEHLWLIEMPNEKTMQLPVSAAAKVSLFSKRGESGQCANLGLTLSEAPWVNKDKQQCLSSFEGVSLRLLAVTLSVKQQKEAKDAKPFWQFEKADDKAKKRMKKI